MRPERDAGFSLVELLVASLITLVVVGSALGLMNPAQRVFQAQPEASDVQQRLRVGVTALRRDLVMAGAGTYAGRVGGALTYFIPPLMPYRAFGGSADPIRGMRFRTEAISFLYVPPTPSQTWLATGLASGALDLDLASPPNCPLPTSSQVCGLGAGDRLLVFDEAGTWDVFTVDQVIGGLVRVQHRGQPAASYAAGAIVTEVEIGTYYFKQDPAGGTSELVHYDGWVTDLPVVDDVVELEFGYFGVAQPPHLTGAPLGGPSGPWTSYGPAPPMVGVTRGLWPAGESCTFTIVDGVHAPRLPTIGTGGLELVDLPSGMLTDGPWCPDAASPNRFDADLLRVRRVHVSFRVQSALASLRGPAGVLFSRGGTARAGDRYVPDLAVRFDVTPRNMNLER